MTILLAHFFTIALVLGVSYWASSFYTKDPTIGLVFMLLGVFLYTSLPLFERDKLNQEVFGTHSGNLIDAAPLIKEYQTLKMNLETCENKLAITEEQFSRYYKDLDIDFTGAIQSINNNIINTQDTTTVEIVGYNTNYFFWGSGILLTIALFGISYYFLSNQTNLLNTFTFWGQARQPNLIGNINNSNSSVANQHTIPELDIPDVPHTLIDNNISDAIVDPSIRFENAIEDYVFDQFVSRLVDDSLAVGLNLNITPQIFDMILNNNQMLQQLLIMNS